MQTVYSKLTEQQQYNIKHGSMVDALYLGTVACRGIVADDRAKYGTKKQYSLVLVNDLVLGFTDKVYYAGTTIAVDHDQIVDVIYVGK